LAVATAASHRAALVIPPCWGDEGTQDPSCSKSTRRTDLNLRSEASARPAQRHSGRCFQ
jgi:hypothetical protein